MKKTYILAIIILAVISACSTASEPVTMKQKYDMPIQDIDEGSYGLATPLLTKVIDENPGTRYAAYSYLKLGDSLLFSGESKFDEAEMNYRLFLNYTSNSHLVPYVLSKLIELNYKRSISAFFGKDYAFSRDPEHFKKIISEYQRFYFLYPDSLYIKDAKTYLNDAVEALAEHEFIIGCWYFDQSLYTPAIYRYKYIISNYPNFSGWERVTQKLITAYKKKQQPEFAEELERVYKLKKEKSKSS